MEKLTSILAAACCMVRPAFWRSGPHHQGHLDPRVGMDPLPPGGETSLRWRIRFLSGVDAHQKHRGHEVAGHVARLFQRLALGHLASSDVPIFSQSPVLFLEVSDLVSQPHGPSSQDGWERVEPEPTAEVALLIRRLRHQVGLTQQQAAERIGVPATTCSRWEHPAKCNATIKTLDRVASAFGRRVEIRFARR